MTQGHTSSPRAQAKREQILKAARSLFLAQGYARTSMDAVTQEAGVSKQTLYAYFPSKVELIAAIVGDELETLEAGIKRPTPETLPELRAALLGFAHTMTRRLMHEEALALLRLLIGEAIHVPDLRKLLRQAFPARLLGRATVLLEEAQQRGLIHTPNPDLSARMFIGPVMSFIALDGLFGDTVPELPGEEELAFIVDAFLETVKER
jgi:TetR/AcrR family transcriptional repressor of mexJK operon